MSTTIEVYPTTDVMPLVEQTRARAQELFEKVLDRRHANTTVEIKAFYPGKEGEELRYVEPGTRWEHDMHLGLAYYVNGEWDSSRGPVALHVTEMT